jgi:ABC-type branched-subunit amino acid transport system substrate-binding protein
MNSSESSTSNSSTINETKEEDVIRLLTILPYPVDPNDGVSLQPFWDGGLAVLPAAQLAVEHVNQDPNTLPGYRVELLNVDGGCDIFSKALMNFAEHVLYGSSIAGIVGPACAPSSLAISSILGRPETALPNIHLAISPFLSNRSKYGNTYGIHGSSLTLVITAISLLEHNKWDKIAALFDSDTYSHLNQNLRNVVTDELQNNRVVFLSAVYDTYIPFDTLVKNSARVIILFTVSPLFAMKLLCIAHVKGMVFPYYQWVVVGHHLDELLRSTITVFHYHDGVLYNCSNRAFLKDNLLIVHQIRNLNVNSPLVSGHTYNDIYENYLRKLSTFNESSVHLLTPDVRAAITYDAVWALTLAINSTLESSTNISSIRYGNKVFTDRIKQSLGTIAFDGASGYINFDSRSGYVNRIVDILHINGSMNDNLVGFFNGRGISITDSQFFINTTTMSRTETVHPSVATIFLLIILFLSSAILLLHIVSMVKRRHPSIKASSPVLNHFIFTGCYIWTAASLIYIIVLKALSSEDEQIYANCCDAVFTWLLPVGWTLIFGTLIAKTWRIYKIFVHFRDPGHLISNRALVSFVLLQLGFDIALGISWSALSPAHLQKTDIPTISKGNPQNLMIVTYLTQRSCVFLDNRVSHLFWIVTVFGYKALQVIVLLTLTLLTKKIVNQRFSTLLLRNVTYLSFILFFSLLPPFIVLWNFDAEIHIDFVLLCTFISGTIFICVTFVLLPPVLPIFKKCKIYYFSCPCHS